jgi:hypothetical protein
MHGSGFLRSPKLRIPPVVDQSMHDKIKSDVTEDTHIPPSNNRVAPGRSHDAQRRQPVIPLRPDERVPIASRLRGAFNVGGR